MTPVNKGSNHENPDYVLIIMLILIIKIPMVIIIIFNVMGGPQYISIYCISGISTPVVTKEESLCVAEIIEKGVQSYKEKRLVYF